MGKGEAHEEVWSFPPSLYQPKVANHRQGPRET